MSVGNHAVGITGKAKVLPERLTWGQFCVTVVPEKEGSFLLLSRLNYLPNLLGKTLQETTALDGPSSTDLELSYPPYLSRSLRWRPKSQLCFSGSACELLVLCCVETKCRLKKKKEQSKQMRLRSAAVTPSCFLFWVKEGSGPFFGVVFEVTSMCICII